MRTIESDTISTAVSRACQEANLHLPPDVIEALEAAAVEETDARARGIIADILENAALSPKTGLPLCQDCGLVVVFAELGQDVRIVGGGLPDARCPRRGSAGLK